MKIPSGSPFRRPSPALVVAAIALLVALSGTSYAAITLPKNSVGAIQIKPGAVTSPKVRNGSLAAADLSPAARRALTGQAGPAGPKGDKGDAGRAGISGWEMVTATTSSDSNSPKTMTVMCTSGKRLLGGSAGAWGRHLIGVPEDVALTASHAAGDRTWVGAAREASPTDESWFLQVTAICATAQ